MIIPSVSEDTSILSTTSTFDGFNDCRNNIFASLVVARVKVSIF